MRERGQSLLEVAFFLPVFIVIIAGLFEMGFFFLDFIDLLDASREGARYGADLDPAAMYPDWDCATSTNTYVVVACFTEDIFGKPLNPDSGYDDIVVTAFEVTNGSVSFRYPDYERYGNQKSRISNMDLNELVGEGPCAQGFIVVEVFYLHRQALGLPMWTWAVPDPIKLYAYTIMPNNTATTAVSAVCP